MTEKMRHRVLIHVLICSLVVEGTVSAQSKLLLMGAGASGGGGGTTPSFVQSTTVSGCIAGFASNPTANCAMPSNTASGNHLVALMIAGGGITSWVTPTGTGSGCSSATWSTAATSTTNAAIYISSSTAAGACTVNLGANNAGATDFTGVIYELAGAGTVDGTPTVATSLNVGFCTSCTGPSTTTATNGSIVLSYSTGSVTDGVLSAPFTADFNSDASHLVLAGHKTQSTAGAVSATWTGSGSSWNSSIVGVK